jgi:hypothetical protein
MFAKLKRSPCAVTGTKLPVVVGITPLSKTLQLFALCPQAEYGCPCFKTVDKGKIDVDQWAETEPKSKERRRLSLFPNRASTFAPD